MVTIGQVAITMVAAGYLIGRKELPHVAKLSGRYVGRTIGAILRAKNEYFEATKNSDIVKMQAELQNGLDELNNIRSEMTTISSMKRPYRPVSNASNLPSGPTTTNVAASDAVAASKVSYSPITTHTAPSSTNNTIAEHADYSQQSYDDLIQSADDQEQARLALAEANMASEQKFASRIESVEGGADYVASSLMDSILLQRKL